MTDEMESKEVELQRAYDMIQRDATAHIAAMKARQWTMTHYALLISVALFYFTNTQVVASNVGKLVIVGGAIAVFAMWVYVTCYAAVSMKEKRQRLNKLYNRFPEPAKDVYGKINCRRESLTYDIGIVICQGAVVLVSVAIVIVKAVTEVGPGSPP